jgi:hypothetical protein
MKRLIGIATAISALASCSSSPPFCGESFCFTEKPTAVSKETPVGDFKLYRTEFTGANFLIYEGNHPNTDGDRDLGPIARAMVPAGFVDGHLFGSERGYQVVLRTTNRNWPAYVAVSAPTKDPKDLDQVLSKLRGTRSKRG